ncbi:MAG TPA: hypothetical protein V6C78_14945 [Crinalium sp.]|jgi:hypothetical protein
MTLDPEQSQESKVTIPIEAAAREGTTQQRQHEHHLHDTMHSRATESLDTPQAELDEKARELTVEQRLQDEHLQQSVHSRAVADTDTSFLDS